MKTKIFHKQLFAKALAEFVESLRATGVEITTTAKFVEFCAGPYLTAVKTPPEHSFNAQCGRMISLYRSHHGLHHAGSKRFRDYKGNRTRTAIWTLSPI